MSLIAIIPARKGSTGIGGKNLVDLGGKPLIQWTIEACLDVTNRVYVSTNDPEIIEMAFDLRVMTILRPDELCSDGVHSSVAVTHAIEQMKMPGGSTIGMFLPTSPFRTSADIIAGLDLFEKHRKPVVGLKEVGPENSIRFVGENGDLYPQTSIKDRHRQRQNVRKIYMVNGALFITKVHAIKSSGTFHDYNQKGLVMSARSSIDINTPDDLSFARANLL